MIGRLTHPPSGIRHEQDHTPANYPAGKHCGTVKLLVKSNFVHSTVRPTAFIIDTLIVGQGLAGTLLAWELERAGQRVAVIDARTQGSASRAAGGLMNPLTGPRLAASPDLMRRCEHARAHYEHLAAQLGQPLVEPMPIRRLCRDAMEQDRARDTRHPWLGDWHADIQSDPFHAPFGSLDIHQGWRLDLAALLARSAARWPMPNQAAAACFDWTAIRPQGQGVCWQGHAVDCVVSCEGAAISANPYWRGLPLLANGGESLILELPMDLEYAISADFTLLPLGRQRYWLGATHHPGRAVSRPTDVGRKALLDALAARLRKPLPIEVLGHCAGTRMAPPDREPVLGRHPKWPWLAIFNGLGSRGILRAPDSAFQLARHLATGASLAQGRDVMRYAKYFKAGFADR